MQSLMEYVDVCIANDEDAEKSLGMKAGASNVDAGELEEASYFEVASKLKDEYDFKAKTNCSRRESKSGYANVSFKCGSVESI